MKKFILILALMVSPIFLMGAASQNASIIEFRLVENLATEQTESLTLLHPQSESEKAGEETLHVRKTALLDHTALKSSGYSKSPTSDEPRIMIELTEAGKERFSELTRQLIGHRLAIVIDGKLVTAPRINSEITGSTAMIIGSFTAEEAQQMVEAINQAVEN